MSHVSDRFSPASTKQFVDWVCDFPWYPAVFTMALGWGRGIAEHEW